MDVLRNVLVPGFVLLNTPEYWVMTGNCNNYFSKRTHLDIEMFEAQLNQGRPASPSE